MAELLKDQFGIAIVKQIAAQIAGVWHQFDPDAFITDTLDGFEALELMQRGRRIAHALHRSLPEHFPRAAEILLASLGPKLEQTAGSGMAPFFYLPHTIFVAEYGLDHFETSMHLQYMLTQRFTAEFSIRPYLERYPEATLARLQAWTQDPSVHVRRLVSEGTRPRLPWAPRLRQFQKDPRPVLALLELLKDDPELYVRRSVANNLNDIGKDHPSVLAETARRWLLDATTERRWVVGHALRSAVKRAEPGALSALGYGQRARVSVSNVRIDPRRVTCGSSVTIALDITNTEADQQQVLVDLCLHFVKANGTTSPKVFKLKTADLAPHGSVKVKKTISLAEMTTRKHYPGVHRVDVVVNGVAQEVGTFELVPTT